jgi:UPF0042 nucleotide-binding protein
VTEPRSAPDQEILVITGMSGAGRSTAAHVLEDLGWYVVDNLPPQLIAQLAKLIRTVAPAVSRVAVVVDVRGRSFFAELNAALIELEADGRPARVLFLDAADEVLVRRYESVRRPHPLQGAGRIVDGIREERRLLGTLRSKAHTVVDTTRLNVHQLSTAVVEAFGDEGAPALRITLMSFGFKHGLPLDADNIADVRFIHNPYWVPELRPFSGLDVQVSSYVLRQEGVTVWLDRYVAALEPAFAGYVRENKRFLTIALGCTGGRHRSVALTEELAGRLRRDDLAITVVHRDLGRE